MNRTMAKTECHPTKTDRTAVARGEVPEGPGTRCKSRRLARTEYPLDVPDYWDKGGGLGDAWDKGVFA